MSSTQKMFRVLFEDDDDEMDEVWLRRKEITVTLHGKHMMEHFLEEHKQVRVSW
jgi:hypothetical protein